MAMRRGGGAVAIGICAFHPTHPHRTQSTSAYLRRLWRAVRGSSQAEGASETPGNSSPSSSSTSSPAPLADVSSGGEVLSRNTPDARAHPTVLAVPVSRRPLLPGLVMPVRISDEPIVSAIEDLRSHGQPYVGAFLLRNSESQQSHYSSMLQHEHSDSASAADVPGSANRPDATTPAALSTLRQTTQAVEQRQADELAGTHMHDYGTFAQVHSVMRQENNDGGGAVVLLMGHRRIYKERVERSEPLYVKVQHLKDEHYEEDDISVKATSQEIFNAIKDLLKHNPVHKEQLQYYVQHVSDLKSPARLADLGAGLCSADEHDLQKVVEMLDVPTRLEHVLYLLKKEVELSKVQADINKKVEERISSDQRKYFLHQQLRSIKRELGIEKDDKEALVQRFRERFEPFRGSAPQAVVSAVDEEVNKLSSLEQNSSEFSVSRNYLDWLTCIPWGRHSEETLDVNRAREVLDEDHHGLQDVKDRILEFIAVGKLRGGTDGRIVCLVGPPGTGKTSVGKSVARAVGRKFNRFSVGGLADASELKGNRRTYVGSMPGKLVHTIKSAQVCNPLILVDEVDKMSRGIHGDPSSALLEALDPEQNGEFQDHYMDVPIDLSRVLFLCTANTLDTIPAPLMDRMEVIRLSGYLAEEKEQIARSYLEPKAIRQSGLQEGSTSLTEGALRALIDKYSRESGVRSLQKQLEKIYRKVAVKVVQEEQDQKSEEQEGASDHMQIGPESLSSYLGPAPFPPEELFNDPPPGVATGLAWTSMGGSILHIESTAADTGEGKGGLQSTGQLGEVMKESTQIAYSFGKAFLRRLGSSEREVSFFDNNALHLHVPAGGTPKDGPSAGCTMITALLSLATGRSVRPGLAMTGEVTLTGRVLPVGGIKEKAIAAKRTGIDTIIFPYANKEEFDELLHEVKRGIDVHFVSEFEDVFRLAFPGVLPEREQESEQREKHAGE